MSGGRNTPGRASSRWSEGAELWGEEPAPEAEAAPQASGEPAADLEHGLALLAELAAELGAGMEAVRANAPGRFQASVSRQQALAQSLALALASRPPVHGPLFDNDLRARWQRATEQLRQLNQKYAALVEHGGRSVRLLLELREAQAGRPLRPAPRLSLSA
jgi:hypothetical protein